MTSEMSGEQMQTRIASARRDAEGLKDKIKRKKEDLGDNSCKYQYCRIRRMSHLKILVNMLSYALSFG